MAILGSSLDPYVLRPWLALYGQRPIDPAVKFQDMLSLYESAVINAGNSEAIRYFDSSFSYFWLDRQSNALAAWLQEDCGVGIGDRVAILLQNTPAFVVAAVAAWKLGAVPMPINPAYTLTELVRLFRDGRPRAAICHPSACATTVSALTEVGLDHAFCVCSSP